MFIFENNSGNSTFLFTLMELNLCTLQKVLCSKLKNVVGIKLDNVCRSAPLIGLSVYIISTVNDDGSHGTAKNTFRYI